MFEADTKQNKIPQKLSVVVQAASRLAACKTPLVNIETQ